MSRKCDLCNKGYLKGNLVPRGIGRRVTNRSGRKQQPNLRRKKIEVNGRNMTIMICTSCLKRMKFEVKKSAQAEE